MRGRPLRDPRLSQWVVAEFSAWEHQRLEPPWWWLLTTIARSCRRELWRVDRKRWISFMLRDAAWHVWNLRATWISLLILGLLATAAIFSDWFGLKGSSLNALQTTTASLAGIAAFGTIVLGYVRGTSRWLAFGSAGGAVKFLKRAQDPLGVYRARFRWLIRAADHPIAVFIDDLDRCKPAYVVELLEGIQTLFAGETVAYVVAADRKWLCECFATEYSDLKEAIDTPGRPMGFLFLEKTFQISMEIPPMSFDERMGYWRGLMAVAPDDEASGHADPVALADAFTDLRTHQDVERQIDDLVASGAQEEAVRRAAVRKLNAPEMQAKLEGFLGEFAPLLENNPRSMKRLLNGYGIERDRLVRERRKLTLQDRKRLVLFTILRLRWPLFAEHLLRNPHEVALANAKEPPVGDHPFASLFQDREVRLLFDGSSLGVELTPELFRRYSGAGPEQSSSVGA